MENPTAPGSAARPPYLRLGLIGLAYFASYELIYLTYASAWIIVAVWLATGVALASLLLNPRRTWPILLGVFFIGGLASNLHSDRPLAASLCYMLANVLEAGLCALLISHWSGERVAFANKNELLALMVAAGLVNACTTCISAGAATFLRAVPFWSFYRSWWASNALGLLFVTPLIVVWATHWRRLFALRWNRLLEATGLMGVGAIVTWLIFSPTTSQQPLWGQTYLVFLLIMWAALRFGLLGTVTVMAVLAMVVVGCAPTEAGVFPLGGADRFARSLTIQSYLGVLFATGLILGSTVDIAARRRRQRERVEDELRELTRQLIDSQEAERRRIALELHDSLGQNLLLIKARTDLATSGHVSSQERDGNLLAVRELVARAISEVRHISHDLRPYQLDQLGLTRALEALIDGVARSAAIAFERKLDPVDDCFSAEAAIHVYRVVQESLNNILKHSAATQVRIEFERDIHQLVLRITDDGKGFTPDARAKASGLGLKNIAERVRILRGQLRVETQPDKGVRLEITFPVAPAVRRTRRAFKMTLGL